MKKNFFNIRVIFDTSPSENGADISTTQERVKE
jgi:hypothetical protein